MSRARAHSIIRNRPLLFRRRSRTDAGVEGRSGRLLGVDQFRERPIGPSAGQFLFPRLVDTEPMEVEARPRGRVDELATVARRPPLWWYTTEGLTIFRMPARRLQRRRSTPVVGALSRPQQVTAKALTFIQDRDIVDPVIGS